MDICIFTVGPKTSDELNGVQSLIAKVLSGVPQGSVLDPLFFLYVYIIHQRSRTSRSNLEYCCPLCNPSGKVTEIRLIEGVQRTFTIRVGGLQHVNYWERLKELKMMSF